MKTRNGYADRPNSRIMKELLNVAGIKRSALADELGTTKACMDNKFTRGSFSFKDFVIASYLCGYKIAFIKNDYALLVDAEDYISSVGKRHIIDNVILKKKQEYEERKKELAELKEKYGFED